MLPYKCLTSPIGLSWAENSGRIRMGENKDNFWKMRENLRQFKAYLFNSDVLWSIQVPGGGHSTFFWVGMCGPDFHTWGFNIGRDFVVKVGSLELKFCEIKLGQNFSFWSWKLSFFCQIFDFGIKIVTLKNGFRQVNYASTGLQN